MLLYGTGGDCERKFEIQIRINHYCIETSLFRASNNQQKFASLRLMYLPLCWQCHTTNWWYISFLFPRYVDAMTDLRRRKGGRPPTRSHQPNRIRRKSMANRHGIHIQPTNRTTASIWLYQIGHLNNKRMIRFWINLEMHLKWIVLYVPA